MKKISNQNTVLFFAILFILVSAFSKNYAQFNDSFFPNDVNVSGPGFFPFANSQGVVDIFNQQGCRNPEFLFDGPPGLSGATFEVGPAANGFETGNRNVLVFDANGNLTFSANGFPLTDPDGNPFDPSMGDILGLSFVPGNGFPSGTSTFMVTTTFNCDNGSSTTTSSSTSSSGSSATSSSGSVASSSGVVRTQLQIVTDAITSERNAKDFLDLKDLAMGGSMFSVSMAIDSLNSSAMDLSDLNSQFEGNDIPLGMGAMASSVQEKLGEASGADNEAAMLLDPFKNTTPSIADGELTVAVTKARKLINEALRAKERVQGKLNMSGMGAK